MSLRPEVMSLMQATGGGRYGRVYSAGYGPVGSGLVGGGMVGGGVSGGKLPLALKVHLYEANPQYAYRIEASNARYEEGVRKGTMLAKGQKMDPAKVAAMKLTRERNKEAAIGLTAQQIDLNPTLSAKEVEAIYKINRANVSADHRAEKARQKRATKVHYPPVARGTVHPAARGRAVYGMVEAPHPASVDYRPGVVVVEEKKEAPSGVVPARRRAYPIQVTRGPSRS